MTDSIEHQYTPKQKRKKEIDFVEFAHSEGEMITPQKIAIYQKLADEGNIKAILKLAEIYYFGKGVPIDIDRAFDFYINGHDYGSAEATTKLAYFYRFGIGVEKDVNKAKELLQANPAIIDYMGVLDLAEIYYNENNLIETTELYRNAMVRGNLIATGYYAQAKFCGSGCDKDCDEAKKLCNQENVLNNPMCQIQRAIMFYTGNCEEQNVQKAYELYESAFQNALLLKEIHAMIFLAKRYFSGVEIRQDKKVAIGIYEECVKLNDVESILKLASIYRSSSDRNYQKAIELYKLAGKLGYNDASKELKIVLREQKKFELKKKIKNSDGEKTLEDKILDLNIDDKYKMILYEKYMSESETKMESKMSAWFDHVVKIPFGILNPIRTEDVSIGKLLKTVREKLDQELFGMEKVKEELLMILNNKLRNPIAGRNTIALVGNPGVGKTAIVLALCKALGIPYHAISMGGKRDVSFFTGHDFTWQGSQPGIIVSALQSMKCINGVIFFDELDKLTDEDRGMQCSNFLLHITDFTQNHNFVDEYIKQVPVNLSNIWFIFSLNDEKKIDSTLRNRMTFVQVNGYSDEEKYQIIKNYIIPKFLKEMALEDDITFTQETIEHIVKKTKQEDGVREAERNIRQILDKVNLLKSLYESGLKIKLSFEIPEFMTPIEMTSHLVDILMKSEKIKTDNAGFMYI